MQEMALFWWVATVNSCVLFADGQLNVSKELPEGPLIQVGIFNYFSISLCAATKACPDFFPLSVAGLESVHDDTVRLTAEAQFANRCI